MSPRVREESFPHNNPIHGLKPTGHIDDPPPTHDPTKILMEARQRHFEEDMESWLDYALDNLENHRTRQTATRGNQAVRQKSTKGFGVPRHDEKAKHYHINTWTLFKAWKVERKTTAGRRIQLRYDEAVPELHLFLDFIADQKALAIDPDTKVHSRAPRFHGPAGDDRPRSTHVDGRGRTPKHIDMSKY